MNCPNCKASNPDGATFCSECGFRMDGETPRHRVRRILVTLLIVLTALGVAMSTVAVWAHSVVFDTDRFVETVGPLIDDPDVQDALATRLTDTIMTGLAIETKVSTALSEAAPDQLPIPATVLAGPVTDGIQSFLHDRIQGLLASGRARDVWIRAVTFAHNEIVSILRGEGQSVTIEGDTAYLNLLPLVNDALSALSGTLSDLFNRQITIPAATDENVQQIAPVLEQQLGIDLPTDFGAIPIFSSDSLETAQAAVQLSDRLVVLLIVITILAAIAALLLSLNRLRTLMWLGLGSAIALIVARRAAIRFQDDLVNLAPGGTNRGAVSEAVSRVLGNLRGFTTLFLVSAIVIAVLAYLASRPSWLTRAMERAGRGDWQLDRENATVRWIAGHVQLLRVVSIVLVGLVLLFSNVTWWTFAILVVLLVAWLVVLSALEPKEAQPIPETKEAQPTPQPNPEP